jgi:hypothetical protein
MGDHMMGLRVKGKQSYFRKIIFRSVQSKKK